MTRLAGKSVPVTCPCGWQDNLPAGAGGLTVQCPRCGAQLRVAQFEPGPALSRQDLGLVERLTGRRLADPRGARSILRAAATGTLACGILLDLLLTDQALRLAILLLTLVAAASLAVFAWRRRDN